VPSRLDDCRDSSPGVWSPSAFADIRSPLIPGLPHPVRCASRLSQPPSALLLRTPPGLFHPVTPMGFTLQSLSPATSPDTLSGPHAIMPLARQPSPATWPSADCGSATQHRQIRTAPGALLSWASPSPGVSPLLRQARIWPMRLPSRACPVPTRCTSTRRPQSLDAEEDRLDSPEPAAPHEVSHLTSRDFRARKHDAREPRCSTQALS
jgi:hypothetical protein